MKAFVEFISLSADDIVTASTACPGQCGVSDNAGSDSDCDGEDNCP